MNLAYLVAGLAYGDEGKGSVVDYLVRTTGARLVVRYNGGPQAAHNVVTKEGRHHTFAQFGSGSFVPGVKTYLSRFMLVEPYALMNELIVLQNTLGNSRTIDKLVIEEGCPIITPWHWAANRERERRRGADRHGSCGFGVGELRQDQTEGKVVLTAGHLKHWNRDVVYASLQAIRYLKNKQLGLDSANKLHTESLEDVMTFYEWFGKQVEIVPNGTLSQLIDGPVVFEGAQGMLLDETHGFQPYTTWTDITYANAMKLLDGVSNVSPYKIGVLRSYMTRHGAGPFEGESPYIKFPDHNSTGEWQGAFRFGYLHIPHVKYALQCIGGVDGIALTHLDQTSDNVIVHQKELGRDGLLMPYQELEEKVGSLIVLESRGQTAEDKLMPVLIG